MKLLKSILLTSGALLAFAASAEAADLPTKKGPTPPAAIDCSGWNWFYNSPVDCPLSAAGFTLYGQIDVGGGYETNASKFNPAYPQGIQQVISGTSHGGAWQGVPNGLSQSNVGVKWKEQVAPSWYIIGDVNFGFDPYSVQFANGPLSLEQNNNLTAFLRSSNGDSSRTYGPVNSRAYIGVQNPTFGTLTFGRQYAFSTDNDNAYDPFGGAYDFSLIGNSGSLGGGLGDTELARYNDSLKYVYSDHGVRAGVLSQVGGWGAGNNAKYGIQGDVGFDWNGFSFDGVYAYNKDAVALSVYGSIPPALLPTTILKATIENENSLQLAAKYKWNQFTLYGGYQNERISNPSDLPTGAVIGTFNGGYQAVYGNGVGAGTLASATQGTTAFPSAKVLNLFWVGGKYSVLPNLDLIAGYYYVHQNDYLGSTETFGTPTASCSANVTANPLGGTLKGTNSGKCAGNENAISGAIDYRPVKRVDLYAGVMYSKVAGGLASGFFADNNISTVAGVRLSF